MALVNKRIIDLPERAELNSDDYTVVDGSNGGTAKYKLSKMQEDITTVDQDVEQLSGTVTQHGQQLTTINQTVTQNTSDITDLKADLTQKAPVIINASDEAEVVTISDGADDMPMKSVVLKLVPHQEGTGDPSPSNVRPISGYTAVNVTRAGKNLLPNRGNSATVAGVAYTVNSDGSVRCVGTSSGTGAFSICSAASMPKMKTGVTYIVSAGPNVSAQGVRFVAPIRSASGAIVTWGDITSASGYTWTAREGDYFDACYLRTNGGNVSIDTDVYPMVRVASDPTFEPYQSTTYPITLPQTVYGGEVDVVNGKLRVTHGIVNLGTLTWTYQSASGLFFSNGSSSCKNNTPKLIFSNREWTPKARQGEVLATDKTICKDSNGRFYVHDSSYSTTAGFQSAMSGSMMCYELATPTEITLDTTTIKTLLGINTIWMDADGTLQAEYPADTKMYIDALTAPDDDMVANSNIANGKYFTVNNKLYISTSAIAQGEQIIVGTNCTQTDLATALNALNS